MKKHDETIALAKDDILSFTRETKTLFYATL